MQQLLRLRQKFRKPLIFGLCGAGGCLIAAALGELFLNVTERPPIVERNPQTVLLLLDTSGSMNENNKLAEVKAAAKDFIARQDLSKDSFAIVGFGSRVQVGTGLTSDLVTLDRAIDNLADGGGTRMDLGIDTARQQLQAASSERYILLFTDGQPAPEPPSEQIDIMFVLDVTGSMDEEISGVQQGIQNFARELSARKLDAQVGLIAFGDRLNGEEPQQLSFDGSVFTADTGYFSDQISRLEQVGGGDDPESSLDALALAARQPFRSQATKVILLITDAPPQIPDREIASLEEVSKVLEDRQISQLHLVIQPSDRAIFEQLQTQAPGDTFPLSETAAGRQGFDSVLPTIGKTIAETAFEEVDRAPIVQATLEQGRLATQEGIDLVAVGTGDADRAFLSQLSGDSERVFYVNAGEFDQAFRAAEKLIADPQILGEQTENEGSLYSFLRQSLPPEQLQTPQFRLIYDALRTGGWTAILAIGTSIALIVGQNLYQRRRLLSLKEVMTGSIGSSVAGLSAGALGLVTSRLLVQTFPREFLLGTRPIVLGSSSEADVYLPKQQGYFPTTAKIFKQADTIVMQYDPDYGQAKGMKKIQHELTDGSRRQFGQLTLEIKINSNSSR